MRRRTWLLLAVMVLAPVAIGYLVFFGAPLGLLGIEHVQRRAGAGSYGIYSGIVLPNTYTSVLTDPLYRRLLAETFRLAGACALVCLLLGYPAAWGLRLAADRLSRSALFGRVAPALVNLTVRGMGWMVVLGEFGLVNLVLRTLRVEADLSRRSHLLNELSELSSMVQVFFPFMVLALYGAVAKIDLSLIRAARNLGATRTRAFFEVVVPLSLPGAAVGVVMVFALATGAYVTVATLGGVKVRAMAETAYQQSATLVNWQLGAAVLAVVLIAAALLLRLLFAGLRRGDRVAAPH